MKKINVGCVRARACKRITFGFVVVEGWIYYMKSWSLTPI